MAFLETHKSEFFLAFDLTQVLHRIWPQFWHKLNASFVETDSQIFKNVESYITRDFNNFSDFFNSTPETKNVLKKSRKRALSI
jgi:hypothetical protein